TTPFGWLTTDCTVNPPIPGSPSTSASASTSWAGERSRWNRGSSNSCAATTSAARVPPTGSPVAVPLDPDIDQLLHVGARGAFDLEHVPVDRHLHARPGPPDPLADRIDDVAQDARRLTDLDQEPAQGQQLDPLGPGRSLAGRGR